MLTLSLAPMVIGFMVVGFLIVSLLMILIVLIQRPQGGGLSEAFGSNSGSGHTAFGAKTGDALTTATIGIFVLFIVAAIILNFATRPGAGPVQASASETPLEQQPAQPEGAPSTTGEDDAGGSDEMPVTQLEGMPTVGDHLENIEQSAEDAVETVEGAVDDAAESVEEAAGDEPSTEDDPE